MPYRNLTSAQRLEFWLTAFIGLFTLINAAAMIEYVCIFNKSTIETSKQTERIICAANTQADAANRMASAAQIQADKTTELASQAKNQAIVANKTLGILRKEFEIEERPYIDVDFSVMDSVTRQPKRPEEDFDVGKPLYVNVRLKNIGKGQAVDIVCHKHVLFGANASKLMVEKRDYDRSGGFALDQGIERWVTTVSLRDPYANETSVFSENEEVNWDGSLPIIVFGRFSYRDIFGTQYCKPFLAKRIKSNWAYLPEFNGITVDRLCPASPGQTLPH